MTKNHNLSKIKKIKNMKNNVVKFLFAIFAIMMLPGLIGCADPVAEHNTLTRAERSEGWILMFDGETSEGWRGYNRSDFPDGWLIEDGTLYCTGTGGDVIYDQKFLDFHLKIDWKISEGGNSGIFILAQEMEGRPIWHTAPEIQILDNVAHPNVNPDQFAPALYDLIPPSVQNTRPAGEWNTIEVILQGAHLTIRQNDADVVHTHIGTPEWDEMVDESKFPLEIFGKLEPGYIGVQDHRDEVWFRNIKIKEL